MEKQEIIESLDRLIVQVDVLKAESGPKSNDFIKWVREVKQFIEKAFGPEHPQLRAFKKIDYYPKQFDILSSESSFKKAWVEGLTAAKGILEALKSELAGAPVAKEVVKEEKPEPVKSETKEHGVQEIESIVEIEDVVIETPVIEVPPTPKEKIKEEKKQAEKNELPSKGKKVLLVDITDDNLNKNIFMFVKKMGYDPVVVDTDTEGDVFVTDALQNSVEGNPVFAVIHWKGDMECGGKKLPKPSAIFGTGFYVAKLTSKKVLIISYDDIDFYDENYSGLNFLGIDNIQELMELKLAREMDAAGLNIDFNFLKKK